MLLPAGSPFPRLLAAATAVHVFVSLFWALVLFPLLPRRRAIVWALLAGAGIAIVDLRLIAPAFFPEVAALSFWPQFADHLMWGAALGATLQWRGARHMLMKPRNG